MVRRGVLIALALTIAIAASGCSNSDTAAKPSQVPEGVSMDAAVGVRAILPETPAPPMLTRPETAVYSYMVWISHAYVRQDSVLASQTFDPFEEVRVDAYIQFNKEQGKALRQEPTELAVKSVKTVENTSTVVASESWRYRYINAKTGKYSTPVYTASYDSTYTLVKLDRGWVVHKVEAKPKGEVK